MIIIHYPLKKVRCVSRLRARRGAFDEKRNVFKRTRNGETTNQDKHRASSPAPQNGIRLAYYCTAILQLYQAGDKLDDAKEKAY